MNKKEYNKIYSEKNRERIREVKKMSFIYIK